ncbi:MAG: portal protein [Herbinix sp.]|nr:portal protein [Herbinix sp.]
MGFFKRDHKAEERAETTDNQNTSPPVDDVLLSAMMGRSELTKAEAINIPAVKGCINFAAYTVSMLPIKLYKEVDGEVIEIKDDPRLRLLNDETGDTLDAVQFWRAMLEDYFLGRGAYAYKNMSLNTVKSIHYVDETFVSINMNTDPIFKDFNILVNGGTYRPDQFVKVLRNTKDGATGKSIIEENSLILSVAFNSLVFEENLVKKGGNKKGFLKSPKKLADEVMTKLKAAWRKLYSNNSDNVVILNEGMEFQEASNSSVEMQLNENKKTNSEEICNIFLFALNIIKGTATEKEYNNAFKMGIMPILRAIISALNKDLLLEREKGSLFFDFDTTEMLKGDMKTRYEAYEIGIRSGVLKIDEARYKENMKAFGIDWINVGLNATLYDTKTKQIYTPNTNKTQDMKFMKGGEDNEK